MRLRRFLPSRGPLLVVNGGLVLALVAGAAWAYSMVTGPAASADEATVSTVPVMRGTVTATVSADGAVESGSTASASFETSGTVTEIAVQVGQTVKKGEILAKVDRTAADRNLEAAEADLAAAQSALDRAADAGEDTSAASNEVTSAELAVEEARDQVDGTVLRAPMGGTVVAVNGTLGGTASGSNGSSGSSGSNGPSGSSGSSGSNGGAAAGQPNGDASGTSAGSTGTGSGFIELADLTELQVAAAFAETDATALAAGQPATVTWNALPETQVDATVAAIDPNATTSGSVVTYRTVLELETLPEGVRVGQTVSVSVVTATVDDAVYVNAAAIERVGNRRTVTVLENGVQTIRPVEVGVETDQFVEITSGLTAGEQVIFTVATGEGETGQFPGGGGFPGGGVPGGGVPGGGRPAGGGR